MAENGVLSAKQARAITALLQAKRVEDAAKAAGVGERTLSRWLTDPTFRAALTHAEDAAIDTAVRKLLLLQDAGLGVIASILADRAAAPTVRLRAAALALDGLLRLRELRDVESRLAALENRLAVEN